MRTAASGVLVESSVAGGAALELVFEPLSEEAVAFGPRAGSLPSAICTERAEKTIATDVMLIVITRASAVRSGRRVIGAL